MINTGLFTSNTSEWLTPQGIFDDLNREFKFTVDVCSTDANCKVDHHLTGIEGLLKRWEGICWMNPPYGREIGKWLEKAYMSSLEGATVVCLIPSRTDTSWWHQYVLKASEIRFIKGRLKFSGAKRNAPFPSAVVVFKPAEADLIISQNAPSALRRPNELGYMPVKLYKCKRCGYEWASRQEGIPVRCANKTCRSPYWLVANN